MEAFGLLLSGFETALSWQNLLYCLIGVTIGMLVGVLPGLGPTTGTAVLLPITFGMDPVPAIVMLSGIYYGAMYGGTITSVLINTPGEAASVITCLDGHPLAKQGRAGTALGVAGIGSFIGGTVAILGLTVVGPPLALMALKFGPPGIFACLLEAASSVSGHGNFNASNSMVICICFSYHLLSKKAIPITFLFKAKRDLATCPDRFHFNKHELVYLHLGS